MPLYLTKDMTSNLFFPLESVGVPIFVGFGSDPFFEWEKLPCFGRDEMHAENHYLRNIPFRSSIVKKPHRHPQFTGFFQVLEKGGGDYIIP